MPNAADLEVRTLPRSRGASRRAAQRAANAEAHDDPLPTMSCGQTSPTMPPGQPPPPNPPNQATPIATTKARLQLQRQHPLGTRFF